MLYEDEYNKQKADQDIALWERKQQYYVNVVNEQKQKRQQQIYKQLEQSSSDQGTAETLDDDFDIADIIGERPETYTKKTEKLQEEFGQFFKLLAQHLKTTSEILRENE